MMRTKTEYPFNLTFDELVDIVEQVTDAALRDYAKGADRLGMHLRKLERRQRKELETALAKKGGA